MLKCTVNHTHLTSPNPQKLVDFYTKVMGGKYVRELTVAGGAKAYDVDLGGLLLRISAATGVDEAYKKAYVEAKGKDHYGLHHLSMSVENLKEAVVELKANGAEFVMPYTGTGPAFIIAPDNVLFELLDKR
jgi:catechol 2,3-dioxygenase-like lactoylglutathione lyase family enzyme